MLLAILLSAQSMAMAALPPFYQSLRDYNALLDMPELHELSGSTAEIKNIDRRGETFRVALSNKCFFEALVIYGSRMPRPGPPIVGPIEFHLVRGKYGCPNE